jgi:hypothetical protein
MFRAFILTALLALTSANTDEISAKSPVGKKILSKARLLNQAYEEDFTWLVDYSIKFDKCHSIHANGGEGAGGGQEEGSSMGGVQHLVQFHLCPTKSSCGSCSGGAEYVVDLREFATSFLEVKQELNESACKTVENSCNCNYYGDDDNSQENCLNKCYSDAGLTCAEDNEFDVEEYLECKEADFGNNYYNNGNGNGNGAAYYIGPVCTNGGKSINLKVFTDAQCTTAAEKGVYEQYHYNYALPYSKESLITRNECISCKEPVEDDGNQYYNNNNNNNNAYYQQDAEEPIELCQELYEQSAKCEKNLSGKDKYSRDTGSCTYIHKVIPALEHVYKKKGGAGAAATFFAVFFALTTAAAAGAAYHFYTQVERSTVGLSGKEGNTFA